MKLHILNKVLGLGIIALGFTAYYIKTKAEQLFSTAKYFAQTVIRPTDLFQDHLHSC